MTTLLSPTIRLQCFQIGDFFTLSFGCCVTAGGLSLVVSGDVTLSSVVALFSLIVFREAWAVCNASLWASALCCLPWALRLRPELVSATGVGVGDRDLDLEWSNLNFLLTPCDRFPIAPRFFILSLSRAKVYGVWAMTGDPLPSELLCVSSLESLITDRPR